MNRIKAENYLAEALALRQRAAAQRIPYVLGGMTLSGMDCQGLCEYLLIRCGIPRSRCNLAGSNAHFRACVWTGTPEECRQRYGHIPAGAWLFILKQDGREPEKYHGDGVGNACHMGVYLGEGQGALHASSSRGRVAAGMFNGTSGSGGWNRVGLCRWVDYQLEETGKASASQAESVHASQSLSDDSMSFSDLAQVSTPDQNPVKMRALPTRRCTLYWKIPHGEDVRVEGLVEADGTTWAKVRSNGRTGYIMSEFIIGG